MTKAQIKAELRRSAMEDASPWFDASYDVWAIADSYLDRVECPFEATIDLRTFYLLVAEAL